MAIKFGVCEWGIPVTGPFAVTLAAEMGYDGLQLGDCGGSSMQYPLNNPRVQEAYLRAAADGGMEFGSIHLRSVFQDKSIDAPAGSPLSELFKTSVSNTIKAAAQMGIPEVMGAAMIRDRELYPNVVSHLRYACQVAEDNGVVFTVETNLTNEENFHLLEEVGHGIKLCFDACNPYLHDSGIPGEMLKEILAKKPEIIRHYHFKDTRTEDFHIGRPAPVLMGTGGADLETQARMVLDSGFGGWVYSETYYFAKPLNDGGDFVGLAKEDCRRLRRLFSR